MTAPSAPSATSAPIAPPASDVPAVRLRTATAERQRATAVIQESVTRGALSEAEGAERVAAAATATYRDELAALVSDLPLSRSKPLWRGRTDAGGVPARGAVLSAYYALLAFISRHRIWTIVVAVVLVAGVVTAGIFGWDELGGGHGHHEQFSSQHEH